MTILPLKDVKTRFSAIADEVAATHDRVIVTRNGRPHVMVISVDDFESLQMTRELLAEPGAMQDILAADQEISAGDYQTLDELRAALEERQRQEDAGAGGMHTLSRSRLEGCQLFRPDRPGEPRSTRPGRFSSSSTGR